MYFDNLFCYPDLLVHLKRASLRATGTVRENRINEKNDVPKDALRGSYAVKHDKNSGINFITVKDSKLVSILSTAAGVTPHISVKRYNKELKKETDIPFPNAFSVYNKYMGGVDIHDMYCYRVMPIIRSKKWTWIIFIRIIQLSIANATVLWNTACTNKNKYTIKDFAVNIAKSYMQSKSKSHEIEKRDSQKYCSSVPCKIRTKKYCKGCDLYFCETCFKESHDNI